MKKTKMREMFGGLVAIVLIVLLLSVGSTIMGYDIPVLSDISSAVGVPPKK